MLSTVYSSSFLHSKCPPSSVSVKILALIVVVIVISVIIVAVSRVYCIVCFGVTLGVRALYYSLTLHCIAFHIIVIVINTVGNKQANKQRKHGCDHLDRATTVIVVGVIGCGRATIITAIAPVTRR